MCLLSFFTWVIVFLLCLPFNSLGSSQMMNSILPFLVLLVAVVTLIVAYLSFWVARRMLYYQLLARYSQNEVGQALEIMGELFETRKADESAFFSILEQYRNCRERRDYNARLVLSGTVTMPSGIRCVLSFDYGFRDVAQGRRQVSQFFITAFEMFSETKALDKPCFKKICEIDSIKLMYYVVEWLEFAHATSWKPDRRKFDGLLAQAKISSESREELRSKRPPKDCETWDDIRKIISKKEALSKESNSTP
jgi:hypothetical protein